MKTTIDLPEDLVRALKFRAVEENRKLKDLVAEVLRRGLADPDPARQEIRRVKLPLIKGGHSARPDDEATPERVAAILLEQDAGSTEHG